MTNDLSEQSEEKGWKLNTRVLMILSAGFMGVVGIAATFLPQEILSYLNHPVDPAGVILVKSVGALFVGFAALNWMARGNLIGGIYSRPVAMGNFMHFALVALTLLKLVITQLSETGYVIITIIYGLFAVAFGVVLFSSGRACR